MSTFFCTSHVGPSETYMCVGCVWRGGMSVESMDQLMRQYRWGQ